MADIWPWRGVKDVNRFRAGRGVQGSSENGARGAIISNTLPGIKAAGNEFGVDLNNSCPQSQNSERRLLNCRSFKLEMY